MFVGPVRPESFTRLPPPLHPASMADPHLSSGDNTECVPNTTSEDELVEVDVVIDDDDEDSEILQRLATRHYYSYTTALGVTVGVGCLLLVLNMLIFAGIYYQRDRDRRRKNRNRACRTNSSPSTENIPMSQRPATPVGSSRPQSPAICHNEKQELPPCYTMTKNSNLPDAPPPPRQNTLPRKPTIDKPAPPMRTSSNPPGGTVKKRVHIQEISV
ncbi:hypothetical protein PPYR_08906 [Photinus pyralis]|uniref:Neuroligin n=1 Tax=Photinus pyralis TaxID=7054 RepID=A0A5N4AKW9_PHOPY|nr:uncharacterized protein LOC116171983 [Photinus pyralis]KAB0797913.1 hypothetical protein PPYR_08906 [Photinus pyralis]